MCMSYYGWGCIIIFFYVLLCRLTLMSDYMMSSKVAGLAPAIRQPACCFFSPVAEAEEQDRFLVYSTKSLFIY